MADNYSLPLPMSGWGSTNNIYLMIKNWLLSLGYDGTISAVDSSLGCNKGGEGLPFGIFLYNDGTFDITLEYITVERSFSSPSGTFDIPFRCID